MLVWCFYAFWYLKSLTMYIQKFNTCHSMTSTCLLKFRCSNNITRRVTEDTVQAILSNRWITQWRFCNSRGRGGGAFSWEAYSEWVGEHLQRWTPGLVHTPCGRLVTRFGKHAKNWNVVQFEINVRTTIIMFCNAGLCSRFLKCFHCGSLHSKPIF